MSKEMDNYYKYMFLNEIENVIRYKFPEIKIISLTESDGIFSLEIEDDGVHTKQMVLDFLEELRNYKSQST